MSRRVHRERRGSAFQLLPLLLVLACQAPHDNPLDPANPDYPYARLSGTVRTASYPHLPIPTAVFEWKPGADLAHSAADGSFLFDRIMPRSGRLLCTHPDYFSDSLAITLQPGKTTDAEFLLNMKPTLDYFRIYSIVLNRYPALRTYQIGVACRINDQDADIDSVWLENSALALRMPLPYNTSAREYQKTCTPAELHLPSIQELPGMDFTVKVADRSGRTVTPGQAAVRRIITDEVTFVEPVNYQAVVAQPSFTWEKLSPGFDFTYTMEIYTADLLPLKVWEKSGISAETTHLWIDRRLDPGDYYWVIWCVDAFGNRARSRPASFTVRSTR
ncbi:MAG TPA: hypothetical protein PL181_14830 [bacterium]|nr:hypothetical protein [bacterium]